MTAFSLFLIIAVGTLVLATMIGVAFTWRRTRKPEDCDAARRVAGFSEHTLTSIRR
jgi:hypothetical protein